MPHNPLRPVRGVFGWSFALTFFGASIVLGLAGGVLGSFLDSRGWLMNQTRMAAPGSTGFPIPTIQPIVCECDKPKPARPVVMTRDYFLAVSASGKQLLVMFTGFAFIGYFLNGLIPLEWIATAFGSGNQFSIPLAATLGLPFYISSEASLPLIRSLLGSGMSQGAAMAFLISGAGTSLGATAGALAIARWRVIIVVVGVLWTGAITFGYFFNLLLAMGVG